MFNVKHDVAQTSSIIEIFKLKTDKYNILMNKIKNSIKDKIHIIFHVKGKGKQFNVFQFLENQKGKSEGYFHLKR